MSDYTVDVNNAAEPIDSRDAWKMAAEMRALKAKMQTVQSAVSFPAGTIAAYVGSQAPAGWFMIPANITDPSYHVGGASSAASLLKGAQYFDLFSALWTNTGLQLYNVSMAPVARGVSALSDWNNNCSMSLPPIAGRAFASHSTTHAMGTLFGEETHTLTVSELPAHTHQIRNYPGGLEVGGSGTGAGNDAVTGITESTGGGTAHNIVQPTYYTAWIIKT